MRTINGVIVDAFTFSYIATALWSSTGDDDEPLNLQYDAEDLHPLALERMAQDCNHFREENAELIAAALAAPPRNQRILTKESIAHDFWLTRNHHGAGFWDGDYPQDLGDKLTEAAHKFPECDLYVGDDGKICI